jgi:circadian clock protein KaiB
MKKKEVWKLKLYVADETPKSKNASANLQRLCEERLKDRCNVEIIDILENPEVASKEQIVAIPTLVKESPLPVRRMIGDLSNTERLLVGLDIRG